MATKTKKSIVKDKKNVNKLDFKFLEGWAKNPNIKSTAEELKIRYDEILETEIKVKHPNYNEEQLYWTTRNRLYSEIKAPLGKKGGGSVWLYYPIYNGYPFDFGTPHYNKNRKKAKKNRKEAIDKGYVRITKTPAGKEIIIPTEERESRKSHGKDLVKPAYIGTIGGVAMPYAMLEKEKWETLKPFEQKVFNPWAKPDHENFIFNKFKRNTWYKIKLNNISKKNDEMYDLQFINESNFEIESDELEELSIDDIKAYYHERTRSLAELEDWHESNPTYSDDGTSTSNYDTLLVEGNVQLIDLAKEDNNSHRLTIDDESLGLGDGNNVPREITIWYDKHLPPIDFGVYSRVMLFCTTKRTQKKDYDGMYTGEFGDVQLTGMAFIVLHRTEPDEIEDETAGDSKESVEVKEDESEEEFEEEPEEDDSDNEKESKW
jgi:hypothetical protein